MEKKCFLEVSRMNKSAALQSAELLSAAQGALLDHRSPADRNEEAKSVGVLLVDRWVH